MKYFSSIPLAVAVLSLLIAGCAKPTNEPGLQTAADASNELSDHSHAGHGDEGQTDMEKLKAELAKMSPEDAASAEAQHVCPVSGEMLGAMGAPKKVDVNGRQLWICCESCRDKLLENPDEYLAKLKQE